MKYPSGTMVSYDMGVVKGQAIVVGMATTGITLLGITYILKDPKINSTDYPYDYFVCPEIYITDNIKTNNFFEKNITVPPPPTPPEDRILIEGKEPPKPPHFNRF